MNYGSELERLLVAGVEAGRSDEVLNLLIAEVSVLLIDGYNSSGRLTLPWVGGLAAIGGVESGRSDEVL